MIIQTDYLVVYVDDHYLGLFFSYLFEKQNHKGFYGENLNELVLQVFQWDGDP